MAFREKRIRNEDIPLGGIEVRRGDDAHKHGAKFIHMVMSALAERGTRNTEVSVGVGVCEVRNKKGEPQGEFFGSVGAKVGEERFVFRPEEAEAMVLAFEKGLEENNDALSKLPEKDVEFLTGMVGAFKHCIKIIQEKSIKELMGDAGMLQ